MSAVAGVTVAIVEGESASSTAWESDDNVTMGGKTGGIVTEGGAIFEASGGLFFGEGRPLLVKAAFGDGV